MAHLEVQRKRSSNWWIWILVLLIVLAVLYYFFRDRIDVNSLFPGGTSSAMLLILSRAAAPHFYKHKT
jgi:ABC-type phosphate/phosphonate transport system permease subunit